MRYKKPERGWIENGVGYIPLSRAMVAIVDPEWVPELEKHNWHAARGGHPDSPYYAATRNKGGKGRILMHRYIFGTTEALVDHINHDTLDNRRANLRAATVAQNGQNTRTPKNNKTGYKGVSWDKENNKFLVVIRHNGKHMHVGRRNTAEAAYALYCETAQRLHGEFACLK